MGRFIYIFNEEDKKELESKGFRLLKGDTKPFIFANDGNITEFECKDAIFSDVMQF